MKPLPVVQNCAHTNGENFKNWTERVIYANCVPSDLRAHFAKGIGIERKFVTFAFVAIEMSIQSLSLSLLFFFGPLFGPTFNPFIHFHFQPYSSVNCRSSLSLSYSPSLFRCNYPLSVFETGRAHLLVWQYLQNEQRERAVVNCNFGHLQMDTLCRSLSLLLKPIRHPSLK